MTSPPSPDRLLLQGMEFYGYHGDIEAERALGGRYSVDVELCADLRAAGRSDSLDDTIDYVRCFQVVRDLVENRQYRLLEAMAEAIAQALLHEHGQARSVRVRVAKQPPVRGTFERFAVEVERAQEGAGGSASRDEEGSGEDVPPRRGEG